MRHLAWAALLLATPVSAQTVLTAEGQAKLLQSPDARLAANKKLVYDMYREIVQGGHAELVEKYFTPEYIQHNPNVVSGRNAIAAYIKGSRPARPLETTIKLPLITLIAEGDLVLVASQRPQKDAEGKDYLTTWFDLYRIENGKIAEHWDPALKTPDMLHFDPNSMRPK
jgi:predicted SnoaL-like aldol condensation-catalyzing enzyme